MTCLKIGGTLVDPATTRTEYCRILTRVAALQCVIETTSKFHSLSYSPDVPHWVVWARLAFVETGTPFYDADGITAGSHLTTMNNYCLHESSY